MNSNPIVTKNDIAILAA